MMATRAMTIANPKKVLVAHIWALDTWHQNVAILIDFAGIIWNIPNSGSESILCDHVLFYVPATIKNLEIIFIVF